MWGGDIDVYSRDDVRVMMMLMVREGGGKIIQRVWMEVYKAWSLQGEGSEGAVGRSTSLLDARQLPASYPSPSCFE